MGLGLVDAVSNLPGAPGGSSSRDTLGQLSAGAKSLIGDFGERLDDGVGALRRMVGEDNDDLEAQRGGFGEELKGLFDLNWTQRLALFAMTFSAGAVLIALSFTFLPWIVLKPHKFAVSFTMGNILAITR